MKNEIFLNNYNRNQIMSGQLISLLILMLATILVGCGSDKDDKGFGFGDKEEEVCDNSGANGYQTMLRGDITREYIIHVPASYDESIASPLLINFHGYGGCAAGYSEDVGALYGLNAVADEENFIVIYPQAIVREKGTAYWEPGDNGIEDINENDAYFTEQLISEINSIYNVDLLRVYATGYSNGGMMSYGLACNRADLIAAAGIMSGIMLPEVCETSEYTSIIHFHGIADDVLPYEGSQDYQSVADVVSFWLDHNNISADNLVTTELNSGKVLRDEYLDGNENTSVVLYTINSEHGKDGGHVWFSDEIEGDAPSKILWDFLSAYSLDD